MPCQITGRIEIFVHINVASSSQDINNFDKNTLECTQTKFLQLLIYKKTL